MSNLLAKIHERWDAEPRITSRVPGGLHQDIVQDEDAKFPYAVMEDVGGTAEIDSCGSGPEDVQTRLWLFGDNPDALTDAMNEITTIFDPLELTLNDGRTAYAMRTVSPKFVTEPELLKPVTVGFQLSVDYQWQL